MADKDCPNYFERRGIKDKIFIECCGSSSRLKSLEEMENIGASYDSCFCDDYTKCHWYMKDLRAGKIFCDNCQKSYYDSRGPQMCSSKKAREYHQSLNHGKHVIAYCEEFNKDNDCQFIEMNLRGLFKQLFSNKK